MYQEVSIKGTEDKLGNKKDKAFAILGNRFRGMRKTQCVHTHTNTTKIKINKET